MKTHFDSTRLMKLTLPLSLIKVIYIVKSSKQFSISLVVNIIKRSHPYYFKYYYYYYFKASRYRG